MSLIQFVQNYDDLSTDQGYQFKFYCDRCQNGYMSSFNPSVMGALGSVARAAGSIFGGFLSSAGSSSYEIQRAGREFHHEPCTKPWRKSAASSINANVAASGFVPTSAGTSRE